MDTVQKKFGRRYPWGKWFASSRFTLTRGREYDCLSHNMAILVRVAASRPQYRVRVSIHVEDARLTVVVENPLRKGA